MSLKSIFGKRKGSPKGTGAMDSLRIGRPEGFLWLTHISVDPSAPFGLFCAVFLISRAARVTSGMAEGARGKQSGKGCDCEEHSRCAQDDRAKYYRLQEGSIGEGGYSKV